MRVIFITVYTVIFDFHWNVYFRLLFYVFSYKQSVHLKASCCPMFHIKQTIKWKTNKEKCTVYMYGIVECCVLCHFPSFWPFPSTFFKNVLFLFVWLVSVTSGKSTIYGLVWFKQHKNKNKNKKRSTEQFISGLIHLITLVFWTQQQNENKHRKINWK